MSTISQSSVTSDSLGSSRSRLDGCFTNSPITTKPIVFEFLPNCYREAIKHCSVLITRNEYQKTSTVKRQCGVYSGTEVETSNDRSSQTAFAFGGLTMVFKIFLDERQQWRTSEKNGKRQFNININLAQLDRLHAVIQTKRPYKKNQLSSTWIMRIHMSRNSSQTGDGASFRMLLAHRPKLPRTTTSTAR